MATASAQFHEPTDDLRPEARDRHRAIVSLVEEIEAVDWYDQRIDAAGDDELGAILRHNRDEEKEHAALLVEWLRRRDPTWDSFLRGYLFTERPIDEMAPEEAPRREGDEAGGREPSLPIGPNTGRETL
jgi:uncharacterized protein